MNNFIYKETIAYENNLYAIEKVFFDDAMEAENVTSADDDTKKRNFAQKIKDKLKKLISEIIAIIDRQSSEILSIIKRVLLSDKGFKEACRKAIKDKKPLEAVKLIAYQYDDSFLDTNLRKFENAINSVADLNKLTDLDSENNPLDMKNKDLVAYVLREAGCPKDITDTNLYFEFLKKGFRVAKKEQLYKSSETKKYYDITSMYDRINKIANNKQNAFRAKVSKLNTSMNSVITNLQYTDDQKRTCLNRSKNMSHLINTNLSVLSIYVQLKIEQMLSYRIVLKKLYQF